MVDVAQFIADWLHQEDHGESIAEHAEKCDVGYNCSQIAAYHRSGRELAEKLEGLSISQAEDWKREWEKRTGLRWYSWRKDRISRHSSGSAIPDLPQYIRDDIDLHDLEEEIAEDVRGQIDQLPDMVNHPSHYIEGREFEPVDVIEDWKLGFLEGQVVKYISRLGRKGPPLEDARKAEFYLRRLISRLEKDDEEE